MSVRDDLTCGGLFHRVRSCGFRRSGRRLVAIAGVIIGVFIFVDLLFLIVYFFSVGADEPIIGHEILYIIGPAILTANIDVVIPFAGPIVIPVSVPVPPDMGTMHVYIEPLVLIDGMADKDAAAYRDCNRDQYLLIAEFLVAGNGKPMGQVENTVGLLYGELYLFGKLPGIMSVVAMAELYHFHVVA